MEQGVEPVARLIWGPKGGPDPSRTALRSPLREPPITADPIALRELQQSGDDTARSEEATPLAPDLPPPLVLQEGQKLPMDPEATAADPQAQPVTPGSETDALAPVEVDSATGAPIGAPPPPPLPPPAESAPEPAQPQKP